SYTRTHERHASNSDSADRPRSCRQFRRRQPRAYDANSSNETSSEHATAADTTTRPPSESLLTKIHQAYPVMAAKLCELLCELARRPNPPCVRQDHVGTRSASLIAYGDGAFPAFERAQCFLQRLHEAATGALWPVQQQTPRIQFPCLVDRRHPLRIQAPGFAVLVETQHAIDHQNCVLGDERAVLLPRFFEHR